MILKTPSSAFVQKDICKMANDIQVQTQGRIHEKPMPIVIVGHVDHGKSTLVGRLLHETNTLPEGKIAEIEAMCARRDVEFEWSFVLDALQVERDQGITLDTTRIWFKSENRNYMLIDAPGHKEFLKNMVTGAANAEGALLVIDAYEGVSEQTKKHAYLLSLLGVEQVVVAINKMDKVDYAEDHFNRVERDIREYLDGIGVTPRSVVPLSARDGAGITSFGDEMPWYSGPSILGVFDTFQPRAALTDSPLRLPVQDVYRHGEERIIVGRIESGELRVGQTVRFAPSGQEAKIQSFEDWNAKTAPLQAKAGQSIAVTLDDDLFIERGEVMTATSDRPMEVHHISGRLFWLVSSPLEYGASLKFKIGAAVHDVVVQSIDRKIDVGELEDGEGEKIEKNEIAEITLKSHKPIVVDLYRDNPQTGRGVLIKDGQIVGGLIIQEDAVSAARNLTRVAHAVTRDERSDANGHQGGVLWMTGLSGAGKSTIAMDLERRLYERKWQVFTIDGDNFRHGLSHDLGFSPEDRAENIRRASEVAKLMAQSGTLVLATFITPLRSDRDIARQVIGDDFYEVHIHADLDVCESRDPKGLYVRARAGEIPEFTGISAPYEEPINPDLKIDSGRVSVARAVAQLVEYADQTFTADTQVLRAAS
jgi:bifunctional enzyme CysN/CysC